MEGSIEQAEWIHMNPDEKLIWAGNPSLWTLAINVVVGLVFIIIGISLTIAFGVGLSWVPPVISGPIVFTPLLLVVVGAAIIGYPLTLLLHTHYVITTHELYRKTGFFRRNVKNIKHDMIQNTSYNQSLIERLLTLGDVMIFTAGTDSTEIVLMNVKQPQQVAKIIKKASNDEGSETNTGESASTEAPVDRTSA